MNIIDLETGGTNAQEQAAQLLVEGFAEHWPRAWPDMDAAKRTVRDELAKGGICRGALDATGGVLGWTSAEPIYDGYVWELNIIAVRPSMQRMGIGRALIEDLEEQVRERGGLTIWLGSDDEDGMTSLAGVDLFPDPLAHLAAIRNYKGHPYEFYRKVGFSIAGVLPDANGLGKPDIFLAKSVARR